MPERLEILSPEQAEISPHQLTGHQNTQEYLSKDRQVAETREDSIPRTQQSAGTRGNAAAEKSGGAQEAARDILMEEERAGQDAEARRMERLNAAYERDRAALAKEDPAFARGSFRDIGHAEGSGEADGHEIRKILAIKKSGLMADLEKDTEKEL